MRDTPERDFDTVAILDVLYLVPRAEWMNFSGECRERLRPGGRLLLKEIDTRPRWKFYRSVLQEFVSVKALGITMGNSFQFASPVRCDRSSLPSGCET